MHHLRILLLFLATLLLPACIAGPGDAEMGSFYAFTKANPSTWSFGEVLTSSQQNLVDDNAAKCPDTFPVPMTFEDDASFQGGIAAFGPITVDTDVTAFFGGPVTCDETFTVNGTSVFNGSAEFENIAQFSASATVVGGTLALTDGANLVIIDAGTLTVAGTGTFQTNLAVNGNLQVNTNATVDGTLAVGGVATHQDKIVLTSTARIIEQTMLGLNSDATIPLGTVKVFYPTGVLTANHTLELPSGASEGETIEVVNDDPTYVVNVLLPGGGVFFNLTYSAAPSPPTPYRGVTASYIGGAWRVFDRQLWNSP